MKITAPEYYRNFKCIADQCRHTCCVGWEIEVDAESLERLRNLPETSGKIVFGDEPHIALLEGERCPFLNERGLCDLILRYGDDVLCQICRDHPRFRNFWSDRTEIGLGLVCEEAARIILSAKTPMRLVTLSDDGAECTLPPDEQYLLEVRARLLDDIAESGPGARLREYLIYRHLADALYDGRLEERIAFIDEAYNEIMTAWSHTDGSFEALVECARVFSYDVEYDTDVLEQRLDRLSETETED